MKVSELIEALKKMDPDRICVLQKDAEGNGYSPLYGVDDNAGYDADSTWSGEVRRQTLSEKDRKAGYTEEDIASEDAKPCVVFYPVN